MPRPILAVAFGLLAMLAASPAPARTAKASIGTVTTGVGSAVGVRVRLHWPAGAARGELELAARVVSAPGLGYRYRDLRWRCPLRRIPGGFECSGEVRARDSAPVQLAVRFDESGARGSVFHGQSRLVVSRVHGVPDRTAIDLAAVPVAWLRALLANGWPAARFTAGTIDGRLAVEAARNRPLRVIGPLRVRNVGLETADASIAAQGLGAALRLDWRQTGRSVLVAVDGQLLGGELLAGNTYVALPGTPVSLQIDAARRGDGGWDVPHLAWGDGDAVVARGTLAFAPDRSLQAMDLEVRSGDMTPLRQRYLSGWLGLFGLGEVDLHGAMDLKLQAARGELTRVEARLHGVDLRDPAQRFVFEGLRGDVRYSSAPGPVRSELRWDAGKLYGLGFGAARLPFESGDGVLRVRGDASVPLMGGRITFRDLAIRPPQDAAGTDIRFGLVLDDIDFGQVSKALGLPAFQGRLSGVIPDARYAGERIDFDGGLSMQLFDGRVEFSSLALERPFGTAPSLTADIALDDLDLLRLTEVLGFGSITGRLDGRIRGLRLVDWTPVAFDARFITDPRPGVRQRISQRAVQNITSVGDASFVTSLQGKLVGVFDDFSYRRIGIGCRLANEVCSMSGLHSGNNAFTIVEGAGLPRLTVVGFNRLVDWPTLVERLTAVGSGEVKPIVQ